VKKWQLKKWQVKKQKQSNPDAGPLRTCVGCGAKKPQRELLRVASQAGSTPALDKNGNAPGRGAYVCENSACVARARKRRAFERALKLRGSVSHEVWDAIGSLVFNL
jgi:predicted RNA-binding protein YlxR (DUF448 family)